jgi:myo-inositol-1(or 4)-monophosphatase
MGLERRAPTLSASQDGELVAGIVYDPLREELFTAEKGKGAYLNSAPIRVSRTAELSEALLATGFPSRKRHENPNIHFYQEFTLRSHGVRRAGSAALDLAYTACGRVDGYWEFNLNPWDTSAGALLVLEAGGTMTAFDGSAFRLDSKEVLATNGVLRDELLGFFEEMFAGHALEPIPTPAEFAARRALRTTP